MEQEELHIGGRECLLFCNGDVSAGLRPVCLLVQTLGRHERPSVAREVELIAAGTQLPFAMVFFEVFDWATDLMPWPDPKVDRQPEVGHHAGETLQYVTETLLPALSERFGELPVILGGYSLGGLFALWASGCTDRFAAVAAASPSVWIRDWLPFAQGHPVLTDAVYLSLGDQEELARNAAIARVGDCIRAQHALLQAQGVTCTLRWESGGHFSDNEGRLARAFLWCLGE